MSSDEEYDTFNENQNEEIRKVAELKKAEFCEKFQVSGWDDDTEGIDEETNPHKNITTEILWAAENGDLTLVKNVIALNKDLLRVQDQDGYTPLHRACYNDHSEVVDFLLSAGADFEATTEDRWQPLHSACRWNNAGCAARLLEVGADVNFTSAGGQTPLHLAASNGNAKETLQVLLMQEQIKGEIKNHSDETPYDIAKRSGKYYKIFEVFDSCINECC